MEGFASFNSFNRIPWERKAYTLGADMHWPMGRSDSPYILVIKRGYRVDVTAPRWAEKFIDVHDHDLLAAAAVHDYLLEMGYDKAFASAEFRRCLRARGFSSIEAWTAFFLTLIWTTLGD